MERGPEHGCDSDSVIAELDFVMQSLVKHTEVVEVVCLGLQCLTVLATPSAPKASSMRYEDVVL